MWYLYFIQPLQKERKDLLSQIWNTNKVGVWFSFLLSNSPKRDAVMASCLFWCYFRDNKQNITYTWSIPVQNQGLPNSLVAHVYSALFLQCDIFCWIVNSISDQGGGWHPFHSNLTGSWLVKTELDFFLLKSEIPGLPFLRLYADDSFLLAKCLIWKEDVVLWNLYEQTHLTHSSL